MVNTDYKYFSGGIDASVLFTENPLSICFLFLFTMRYVDQTFSVASATILYWRLGRNRGSPAGSDRRLEKAE